VIHAVEGGGAEGELHAASTMAVTSAARLARPRQWPGVLAWVLWALAMLGLPVVAWLDHLSRHVRVHVHMSFGGRLHMSLQQGGLQPLS
jgi:hypothetical protein